MTDSGPKPHIPYWHIYTGDDGTSRMTQCFLSRWEYKGVGPADPQWNNKQETSQATAAFTVQPVGWVGDWHENPAPQWIVVMSGRWWVESMDGTRVEMGPGELMMGEDQHCTETGGTKGHKSGTVGDQPCVLMCMQLAVEPVPAACHFT